MSYRKNVLDDVVVAVTCLNGEVQVGDTVAAAANNSGGLRMGIVTGLREKQRYGRTFAEIQIRVEKSSAGTGYTYRYEEIDGERRYVRVERPYFQWYEPDNVVKIHSPRPEIPGAIVPEHLRRVSA